MRKQPCTLYTVQYGVNRTRARARLVKAQGRVGQGRQGRTGQRLLVRSAYRLTISSRCSGFMKMGVQRSTSPLGSGPPVRYLIGQGVARRTYNLRSCSEYCKRNGHENTVSAAEAAGWKHDVSLTSNSGERMNCRASDPLDSSEALTSP